MIFVRIFDQDPVLTPVVTSLADAESLSGPNAYPSFDADMGFGSESFGLPFETPGFNLFGQGQLFGASNGGFYPHLMTATFWSGADTFSPDISLRKALDLFREPAGDPGSFERSGLEISTREAGIERQAGDGPRQFFDVTTADPVVPETHVSAGAPRSDVSSGSDVADFLAFDFSTVATSIGSRFVQDAVSTGPSSWAGSILSALGAGGNGSGDSNFVESLLADLLAAPAEEVFDNVLVVESGVSGTDQNDLLIGVGDGQNSIWLRGNDGDDTLVNGVGYNVMFGGEGDDTFVIAPSRIDGAVVIRDFETGAGSGDVIDLRGMGPSSFDDLRNWSDHAFNTRGDGSEYHELRFDFGDGNTLMMRSDSGSFFTADDFLFGDTEQLPSQVVPLSSDTPDPDQIVVGTDERDWIDGGTGNDHLSGGDGNDLITGNLGDDVIFGGDVGDILRGEEGDDEIHGENGHDFIEGGDGNDILTGGDGNDVIRGDAGDDRISGGESGDILSGGDGDDILNGGASRDIMDGGAGDDTYQIAFGAGSADIISSFEAGSDGGDKIELIDFGITNYAELSMYLELDSVPGQVTFWVPGGDGFVATVNGEELTPDDFVFTNTDGITDPTTRALAANVDYLEGTAADDTLSTGAGDDFLFGDAGNDNLSGGGDDDHLQGGLGNDILDGGAGVDAASYSGATASVTVTLADGGPGVSSGGAGVDQLNNIENVSGSAYADVLSGNSGDNTLVGATGDDILSGGGGDDRLFGGSGDDTLSGGAGNDYLHGGDGSNTFIFEAGGGHDTVRYSPNVDGFTVDLRGFGLTSFEDVVSAITPHVGPGAGPVKIEFATGDSLTIDGASERTLTSEMFLLDSNQSAVNSVIQGTGWADTLTAPGVDISFHIEGGAGNDVINGHAGDDFLYGGAGDDTITGGAGDDWIVGGSGNGANGDDLFVFEDGSGDDRIRDFTAGAGTDDRLDVSAFGFSDLADLLSASSEAGGSTTISLDADDSVHLFGVRAADLHEDDFIF